MPIPRDIFVLDSEDGRILLPSSPPQTRQPRATDETTTIVTMEEAESFVYGYDDQRDTVSLNDCDVDMYEYEEQDLDNRFTNRIERRASLPAAMHFSTFGNEATVEAPIKPMFKGTRRASLAAVIMPPVPITTIPAIIGLSSGGRRGSLVSLLGAASVVSGAPLTLTAERWEDARRVSNESPGYPRRRQSAGSAWDSGVNAMCTRMPSCPRRRRSNERSVGEISALWQSGARRRSNHMPSLPTRRQTAEHSMRRLTAEHSRTSDQFQDSLSELGDCPVQVPQRMPTMESILID